MPELFCTLCGSTNLADLGEHIGICLDATACHQRQYARLRDRADAATARAEVAEARLAAFEAHLPAVLDALRLAETDTAYGSRAERFTAALGALDGSEEATGHGG